MSLTVTRLKDILVLTQEDLDLLESYGLIDLRVNNFDFSVATLFELFFTREQDSYIDIIVVGIAENPNENPVGPTRYIGNIQYGILTAREPIDGIENYVIEKPKMKEPIIQRLHELQTFLEITRG